MNPYLRPLHDALFDMVDYEKATAFIERGTVEVAPLAFMRGRTLNDAFIILDEAQNTTAEQMKMFLTRLGYGSKAVITGDVTQVDLPTGRGSGLIEVQKVLRGVEGLAFCHFSEIDVVRHPLVQEVVRAYDVFDAERKARADAAKGERDRERSARTARRAGGRASVLTRARDLEACDRVRRARASPPPGCDRADPGASSGAPCQATPTKPRARARRRRRCAPRLARGDWRGPRPPARCSSCSSRPRPGLLLAPAAGAPAARARTRSAAPRRRPSRRSATTRSRTRTRRRGGAPRPPRPSGPCTTSTRAPRTRRPRAIHAAFELMREEEAAVAASRDAEELARRYARAARRLRGAAPGARRATTISPRSAQARFSAEVERALAALGAARPRRASSSRTRSSSPPSASAASSSARSAAARCTASGASRTSRSCGPWSVRGRRSRGAAAARLEREPPALRAAVQRLAMAMVRPTLEHNQARDRAAQERGRRAREAGRRSRSSAARRSSATASAIEKRHLVVFDGIRAQRRDEDVSRGAARRRRARGARRRAALGASRGGTSRRSGPRGATRSCSRSLLVGTLALGAVGLRRRRTRSHERFPALARARRSSTSSRSRRAR